LVFRISLGEGLLDPLGGDLAASTDLHPVR